ncbi:MAG: hypothetical protein AAF512_07545, partial [Pseudomonadota bacterium]
MFITSISFAFALATQPLATNEQYYLYLGFQQDVSDTVDVYRSRENSSDGAHQGEYLAQSPYRYTDIEPHMLFFVYSAPKQDSIHQQILERLPLMERVREYWHSGFINKALAAPTKHSIDPANYRRAEDILKILSGFRTAKALNFLETRLSEVKNDHLKQKIHDSLKTISPPFEKLERWGQSDNN